MIREQETTYSLLSRSRLMVPSILLRSWSTSSSTTLMEGRVVVLLLLSFSPGTLFLNAWLSKTVVLVRYEKDTTD